MHISQMGTTLSVQSVLSEHPADVRKPLIHCKSYLQPFERALACLELRGLSISAAPTGEAGGDLFLLASTLSPSVERLIHRLAYFDTYASAGKIYPTRQALRESPVGSHRSNELPRRRVLRFGPHDFHEYRGKFFPQLVRSLCNSAGLLDRSSTVLDPMCGSGTTLVEARALDLRSIGMDLNPLSVLVSDVKASSVGWTVDQVQRMNRTLSRMGLASGTPEWWDEADRTYLQRWFSRTALSEIARLASAITELGEETTKKFAKVCLSNILRTVSYQKVDDLRVRSEVRPYSEGSALKLFRHEAARSLDAIGRLIEIDGGHTVPYEIVVGDSRSLSSRLSSWRGRIDLVITSPPYAMALPYLDTDRLSLIVLGLLERREHRFAEREMIGTREFSEKERQWMWKIYQDHKVEMPPAICSAIDSLARLYHGRGVGFRRRNTPALLAKYFIDMKVMLLELHKMLRPGGTAYIIVGNNSTKANGHRIEISTDRFLSMISESVGFQIQSTLNLELLVSRDIFRKNRGSRETLLCLNKA